MGALADTVPDAQQCAEPEVGDSVGGAYRVRSVLGRGGMGVVFEALELETERRVALKLMASGEKTPDAAARRFLREARLVGAIDSPHVTRVYGVGEDRDTPFIVMELLEGATLREVISERAPLPIESAVDYLLQACEGVAEAHALGIVHRDLKPTNLFLAKQECLPAIVKVLDQPTRSSATRAIPRPILSGCAR